MRNATFLILLNAFNFAYAAPTPSKTIFYEGTARLVSLSNGSVALEQVLLKKTFDPASSTLTEVACFKDEGKPATVSPVYMKVSGTSMQISDNADFSPGRLTGSGTLQGTDWDWNILRWSMQYQTPNGIVSVEDVNFVVGNQLIGRKQMFFNGQPFRLWEIEMTEIDEPSFVSNSTLTGCPAF